MNDAPLKPTRAALFAWLEEQGLAHLARLNLEAAAPFVDRELWPRLQTLGAKRRLTELASVEGVAKAREWLAPTPLHDVLPAAVAALIEHEVRNTALAKEQLADRLAAPADARLKAVHERLLLVRSRFPSSVAPRLASLLGAEALEFDATLPGFRLRELVPSEHPLGSGGGFARAKVALTLAEGRPAISCSCGELACVHGLAAIDTALLLLKTGLEPRVFEALSRPAWERALAALQNAYSSKKRVKESEVEFRVDVDGAHITLSAWADGEPLDSQASLSARDAQLVALLPDDGDVPRLLLEQLVGFPRLTLASDPEKSVQFERGLVGIAAEDRLGLVHLTPALDGAPMPGPLADRVRRAKSDDGLWLWDEGKRVLTLLVVKPEIRSMLEVLAREGTSFPPESHDALLASLSQWAERVPVSMPRSVMGETVRATRAFVVRVEAHPSGIEVELRVRPLPDAPSMFPGLGAKDLYLRRKEAAFHTVRDLKAEEAEGLALVKELELPAPMPRSDWAFTLDEAGDVFGLIERCSRRTPAIEFEWVGKPIRNFGAIGPRALRVQIEEKMDWFGALGELSVFGERVELARMIEAVRRDARYVKVTSHDYVELNDALRAHLSAVAAHAVQVRGALQFGPAVVEVLRTLESAGATIEGDDAWAKLVARAEAARALDPRVPKGLRAKLRAYQVDAFRWLTRLAAWGAGGVLADDMGLGKTVQALAVLVDRAKKGPALVVAPTSVAFNWQDEAKRFAPGLNVVVYSDSNNREYLLDQLKPRDVLVVSYGLLVRDAKKLSRVEFATAVFDEAQQLKNAQTQRFHAAKAIRAGFKFALSGTPLENHLGELWTLFALVFPQLLGSWESFRSTHAVAIEKTADPRAPAALARVITPFLLRRTKSEVESELPPRTEIRVPVTLSADEWQLYEDTRLAALSDIESPSFVLRDQQRRVQVLAMLTRLRLAASHPKLLDQYSVLPSSKMERLMELVDQLRATGQRMLIFSQFTTLLAIVEQALQAKGIAFLSLDGSTPAAERRARVTAFQEGTAPVFLISVKAGGFGLNLTAATNVIHLDPWWNPAVEDQASDRAHRIGQQRAVTIYRLISSGTVEEKMLVLHAKKRSLITKVLEGHNQAGKLSMGDLMNLLAPSDSPHGRIEADRARATQGA